MALPRIYRRNPLAFPGGRNPGFDPAHIASANLRYSAIAAGKNCLQIAPTLATGTTSVGGNIINGTIGPVLNTTGTFQSATLPGSTPAVADTAITLAAIAMFTSATGNQACVLASTGTSNTAAFFLNVIATTGVFSFSGFSTSPSNSFGVNIGTLSVNVPYFLVGSISVASGILSINGLLVNLLSGEVKSLIGTRTVNAFIPSGVFQVMNNGNNPSWQLAASMCSATFLSLPQLLQWAKSPWDFWYPPTVENLLFSSLRASIAAISTGWFPLAR